MPTTTATRFASALSEQPEALLAADEAVQAVQQQLTGPVDVLVALASAHHAGSLGLISQKLSHELRPGVLVVTAAEGVLGVGREIEQAPGLSLWAAVMPGVRFEALRLAGPDTADPTTLSRRLGQPAVQDQAPTQPQPENDSASPSESSVEQRGLGTPPKAVVVLGDPFSVRVDQLLPSLAQVLPGVPVMGGMVSGVRRPGQARLLLDGEAYDDGLIGFTVGGALDVSCLVSQGCKPVGRPLVITRNEGHLVHELSGKPALEALQELIEELDEADRELLQRNGILVGRVINEHKPYFGRNDFLIRPLMQADPNSGTLVVGDRSLKTGQTVQFHARDEQTAKEDLDLLLEAQKLYDPPAGGLLFTCNGRGKRLFSEPHTDAKTIQGALGSMPLAGFFAAGEIGPIDGQNQLHSHTASLLILRPQDSAAG